MRDFLQKNPFWRNTLFSAIAHIAVILGLIIWSVTSCIMRRKSREITTFVDLQLEMPAVPAPASAPEPVSPPSPEPAPPRPAPIPEPTPPKPEKPKTPAPKPEKPKVEVSKKVVQRTAKPTVAKVDETKLRQMLSDALPTTSRATVSGSAEIAFAGYLTQVHNAMYEVWQQPSALAGRRGLLTQMQIRVRRDGVITRRNMLKPSGNTLMDNSVTRAVESVNSLPPLPHGFGSDYKDITIDFELTE